MMRHSIAAFALAFSVATGIANIPALALPGQTARSGQQFEAAIIKPSNGSAGVAGGCRGIDSSVAAGDPRASVPLGRCVITSGALRHVMTIAFDIPLDRLAGLPDWDRSNRFDIQARAEDPVVTTEQQLRSMLQQFLIDEFRLTLHREQKEGPTFSLVAARNGPRNLRPSNLTGCSMTAPNIAGFALAGCTMAEFASFLSSMPPVQRPVKDMTALTGRFDLSLEIGVKPQDVVELKTALAGWESLFTDIQEQLGLRLERSTSPIETLIIDHAELPRDH